MIVVEVIGHTNNWYEGFFGKKFVVKWRREKVKRYRELGYKGYYEVIAPYPKSFVPHDNWWLKMNCGTFTLPEEAVKIIKKLPKNQKVKRGYIYHVKK